MRKNILFVSLVLFIVSCQNISPVNSMINELDKKFENIDYAQYKYSDFRPSEIDDWYYIMIKKNDQRIVYYYNSETFSHQEGTLLTTVTSSSTFFLTPTYGFLLDRKDGKPFGEFYDYSATDEFYKDLYSAKTKPTSILSYFVENGCLWNLLEDEKVDGFDTCGVKITANDKILGDKELPYTLIMRFDKKTGFLVLEEKYDDKGTVIFSRKLKKLRSGHLSGRSERT